MWALPGLPPRMPRNHLKSSDTEGSPNSSSNTAKISGPCMQRRTAGAFASTCAAGVLSIPPRVSSAASSSTASLPGRSQLTHVERSYLGGMKAKIRGYHR